MGALSQILCALENKLHGNKKLLQMHKKSLRSYACGVLASGSHRVSSIQATQSDFINEFLRKKSL